MPQTKTRKNVTVMESDVSTVGSLEKVQGSCRRVLRQAPGLFWLSRLSLYSIYLPNTYPITFTILVAAFGQVKPFSRHTYTKNQRSNSEEKLQKQTFNNQIIFLC
jgi:hypothetical protein